MVHSTRGQVRSTRQLDQSKLDKTIRDPSTLDAGRKSQEHLTRKVPKCLPMFPPPPKPTISHSPLIFSRQHPPSFAPLSIFHISNNPHFLVSILHHPPLCQYFIGMFQIFLKFQATGNFEQICALAKTMAYTFIETFEHDISGKKTFLSQIESITKLFEKSK